MLSTETKRAWGCIVFAAVCVPAADATVIFNSGGAYTIDAPVYDNVVIDHSDATVAINASGLVRGVDTTQPSNAVTFGSNWRGTFTVHNVPEPGTIGLILIGLAGMTSVKRRRHAPQA